MAPTDDGQSVADELKKLHQLVEFGAISKEDFELAKEKMIMGVSAPVDEHDSARSQPSDGRAWERKVSRALSEAQKKNEQIRITVSLIPIVIGLIILVIFVLMTVGS